ncbi:protein kinase family protein [Aspergillus clavatus NRRL 1]|uniref:Protein kinase domain-containing protein n=1 Tax=Aspergillus clavatus (strain ATCC 1007 / CBS 513.65 / DSM 816 / NCTC 3887 / NRRL 1 / QM 1276 / 107) TaxID=344612 RepID=A1C6L4_ASPCL|nr:Protein kinase domain-containing protein [Aspergillus clavatus NRRL 1]EAW14035.1 Protein kinase domain-containing protein [Aspergillus clavatus NRRL 1]
MAISIADSSYSPTRHLGLILDPEKAKPRPKQSMWHRLGLRRLLGRDDRDLSSRSSSGDSSSPTTNPPAAAASSSSSKPHNNLTRRLSRRVGVGLPRSTTFKRQDSERRDRLAPIEPEPRRAVSADRHRPLSAQRTRSPQPTVDPRLSAPEVPWHDHAEEPTVEEPPATNEESEVMSEWNPYPDTTDVPEEPPQQHQHQQEEEDVVEMELDKRWILNLSMHFRDRSEREKFFVTYAEAPNRWRRVTISCDYRDAAPDSLEQDLKELRYQRDKCARIYESIRESLPEIQFYDTVTNLKLETRDGRLHVHVTEDVNEIIPYPPISCIGHLPEARLVPEYQLHFEAHLSGFVYNVQSGGKNCIKKEIPGPDTVDEFLYEINALHALKGSPNVIQVEGIVVDDQEDVVKGLLISYAEQGALVDILYEQRGTISWERRLRWAKQIVHGLGEIHESGYVQGDFTLSNIVVDANDDAKIIDINRRGCPVGWEPPEIAAKIESNQRISMYIGVKTDLYQLGMTLWALATGEDEPERQPRPLMLGEDIEVPDWYRRVVSICLSPSPRHRLSAKELLDFFPRDMSAVASTVPSTHLPHAGLGVGLHHSSLPLYNARAIAAPSTFFGSSPRSSYQQFQNHYTHIPVDEAHFYNNRSASLQPRSEGDSYHEQLVTTDEPPDLMQDYELDNQPHGLAQYHDRQQYLDSQGTEVYPPYSHPPIDMDAQMPRGHPPEHDGADNISLDACETSCYPPIDQEADSLSFQIDHFPQELAGVGGHPACSVGSTREPSSHSINYHTSSASSATTQSTHPRSPHIADLDHPYLTSQNWSSQVSTTNSVSSLLHSVLPINPASTLSKPKPVEPNTDRLSQLAMRSAFGYPSRHLQEQTPYLSDSHLPINPAFAEKALKSL